MPIIHLVDDDIAVTDACQFLLESLGLTVKVWNDSEDFVHNVQMFERGIVLLDLRMPKLDGRQVHQYLRENRSTLAVIFLTGHGDVPMAVEQMKLGAVDFLQKPVATEPLQKALNRAIAISDTTYSNALILAHYESLTPKEKIIAGYVAQGLMNREIADVACISVRTVEVHRSKVMEKMQVSNFAELVRHLKAIESDII